MKCEDCNKDTRGKEYSLCDECYDRLLDSIDELESIIFKEDVWSDDFSEDLVDDVVRRYYN